MLQARLILIQFQFCIDILPIFCIEELLLGFVLSGSDMYCEKKISSDNSK